MKEKNKRWIDIKRHRLLHFVWLIFPKKYEIIKGNVIPYMKLPFSLVGYNARVLHHRASDKIMIFLAEKDQFHRYTVYHEYREGQVFRQLHHKEIDNQWILEFVMQRIELIYEVNNIPVPQKISNELKEKLEEWVNFQTAHVVAILDEIELAKKELSIEKLKIFYKEITKKKRFG